MHDCDAAASVRRAGAGRTSTQPENCQVRRSNPAEDGGASLDRCLALVYAPARNLAGGRSSNSTAKSRSPPDRGLLALRATAPASCGGCNRGPFSQVPRTDMVEPCRVRSGVNRCVEAAARSRPTAGLGVAASRACSWRRAWLSAPPWRAVHRTKDRNLRRRRACLPRPSRRATGPLITLSGPWISSTSGCSRSRSCPSTSCRSTPRARSCFR